MASAWGDSWGDAWGDSWGSIDGGPEPPVEGTPKSGFLCNVGRMMNRGLGIILMIGTIWPLIEKS